MSAPTVIAELVERFRNNEASYKASGYNEAQLRREFIDPMFRQLGWDVDNVKGYAEAYKDVIHEDSLKIGEDFEGSRLCFSDRRNTQVFPRGQEACRERRRRCRRGLSVETLRLEREVAFVGAHEFRRFRGLRLPHKAGKGRPSQCRSHSVYYLRRTKSEVGGNKFDLLSRRNLEGVLRSICGRCHKEAWHDRGRRRIP